MSAMHTTPINHHSWQTMNQGKLPSSASGNFSAALNQATENIENPKSEDRNTKQIQDSKSEISNLKLESSNGPVGMRYRGTGVSPVVHGRDAHATDQHAQIEKQTRKWVAETFYGAVLKEMRNSPFKSKVFDGGRGAEAFSPLLDQQLADHIGGAQSNKLVRAVVNEIERNKASGARVPKMNAPQPDFSGMRSYVATNR